MAYLTVDQVRESPLLDNVERFPDALIDSLVEEFEGLAERFRGVAYEPREVSVMLPGVVGVSLVLPHRLVSAVSAGSVAGTAFTQDDMNDLTIWPDMGVVERSAGWDGPVALTYTHGFAEPPAGLLRACREYVRAKALEHTGNQPRNAISYTDDSGYSYRESTADWAAGRPTGLLVVDAILGQLEDYRSLTVA